MTDEQLILIDEPAEHVRRETQWRGGLSVTVTVACVHAGCGWVSQIS